MPHEYTFPRYLVEFVQGGGNIDNIVSLSSHWLNNTPLDILILASRSGKVPNPK